MSRTYLPLPGGYCKSSSNLAFPTWELKFCTSKPYLCYLFHLFYLSKWCHSSSISVGQELEIHLRFFISPHLPRLTNQQSFTGQSSGSHCSLLPSPVAPCKLTRPRALCSLLQEADCEDTSMAPVPCGLWLLSVKGEPG